MQDIDIRISTLPTICREKIVLRLLPMRGQKYFNKKMTENIAVFLRIYI